MSAVICIHISLQALDLESKVYLHVILAVRLYVWVVKCESKWFLNIITCWTYLPCLPRTSLGANVQHLDRSLQSDTHIVHLDISLLDSILAKKNIGFGISSMPFLETCCGGV